MSSETYVKISIPATFKEKEIIEDFFLLNKKYKKGETVKSWILSAIKDIERATKTRDQASPLREIMRGRT